MKSRAIGFSLGCSASKRTASVAAVSLLGLIGLTGVVPAVHADAVPYKYTLTLTPTDKKAGEAYQQQADDPCVLGDESCDSPAGWYHPLTNNGGKAALIDKWSFGTEGKNAPNNLHQWTAAGYLKEDKDGSVGPFYTFSQLSNVLTCGLISGCAPAAPTESIGFFIGLDTNGSSVPQHLYLFEIYECTFPLKGTGTNLGNTDSCIPFAGFVDSDKTDAGGPNLSDQDTGTGWTNYILSATDMEFTKGHIYAFHAKYDQNGGSDSFFLINSDTTPGGPPGGGVPLPGTLALLGVGLLGLVRARRIGRARKG